MLLVMTSTAQAPAWAGPYPPLLMGCYSSSEGLTYNDTNAFQSNGHCKDQCGPLNKAVMAMTGGTDCWCGDMMPPLSTKVDDKFCDTGCVSWKEDNCTLGL